jgi:hypothetical protein
MEFAEFEHTQRLTQQRELYEESFPENKQTPASSVEHYQWKFHHFPSSTPSYEYAAISEGALLGYYAAIPYPYRLKGHRVVAGMVCDVMTHSKARGKGVFTELGRFALAKMEATELGFVTGYPIRPEVMGGHIRAGWQVAFDLPMYLKPLRTNAILKSKDSSWLAPVLNLGAAAYQALLAPRPSMIKGYRSKTGPHTELFGSPQFDRFLETWSESIQNHLIKSAQFYAWRLSAPETQYQAFLVSRDNNIVAAAVGREALLHDIPSFALLDVMVLSDEERALPMLYHEIEVEARRRNVEAIVTMMSRLRARQHRLVRFGFLKSPFKFKLILRSLKNDVTIEDISAEKDWHLMWIDSDDL